MKIFVQTKGKTLQARSIFLIWFFLFGTIFFAVIASHLILVELDLRDSPCDEITSVPGQAVLSKEYVNKNKVCELKEGQIGYTAIHAIDIDSNGNLWINKHWDLYPKDAIPARVIVKKLKEGYEVLVRDIGYRWSYQNIVHKEIYEPIMKFSIIETDDVKVERQTTDIVPNAPPPPGENNEN